MEIATTLEKKQAIPSGLTLTIGNFDGFHLGHRALIEKLKQKSSENDSQTAVITFTNHPSKIIKPDNPTPLICTTEHKIRLLQETGINHLFLLDFTEEFRDQPAEMFLKNLKKSLPLKSLLLGSDAHIGRNQDGDQEKVTQAAKSMSFDVSYFPDVNLDGKRISSGWIRSLIYAGDLESVTPLLGRPYTIYAPVVRGIGKGSSIGYPTANIDVRELALPPLGVYLVSVTCENVLYYGVANLGIAPTVRETKTPLLEIHLFNQSMDFTGKFFETTLKNYIRPERRFENIDDLKYQIANDVHFAKSLLA